MMARPTLLAVLALTLAGCASTPPAMTWLSLPTVLMPPPAPTPTATHQPTWVVQRVRIPEYLQSAHVRYRDSAHTLREWPHARWAERLEVALSRHLAQSLQAALPHARVCEAPCANGVNGTNGTNGTNGSDVAQIQVIYQSLDWLPAQGRVVAVVRWEQHSGEARNGQIQIDTPATGRDARAQAAVFAQVNADVAQAVARALVAEPAQAAN